MLSCHCGRHGLACKLPTDLKGNAMPLPHKLLVTRSSTCRVSFDAKAKHWLQKNDSVRMSIAPWPLPMITAETMDQDWFVSITQKLLWNTIIKRRPRDEGRQVVPLSQASLCAPCQIFYRSKTRNTRGWQPWQLIVASRDREKEIASESVLAVHLKSSSARVLKMS
jgi:hypothetical protein